MTMALPFNNDKRRISHTAVQSTPSLQSAISAHLLALALEFGHPPLQFGDSCVTDGFRLKKIEARGERTLLHAHKPYASMCAY